MTTSIAHDIRHQQDPFMPPAFDVAAELDRRPPLTTLRTLQIHCFFGDECPQTLLAIGRLRELGFQSAGAGRGVDIDLDRLDRGDGCYGQLLAWDPDNREIVAMYRFQLGERATTHGDAQLRTSTLFDYSDRFRAELLPYCIELGRSVVNRAARRQSMGFFAVWAGLGALLRRYTSVAYFFGNVSLYETMDLTGRDLLIAWLEKHYRPQETLLRARDGLRHVPALSTSDLTAVEPGQEDTPENRIQYLRSLLAEQGEKIPPVMQSYMALSNGIWCGETVFDADFGDALEIGIIVPVATINDSIRQRFINAT
ncbi:MAG: GNAT family N-acetyltransferase [Natronospirillum sp.]|uniref:GNAT family N-acyltransferase n=1 Tax=Natronospirillum sp. TaxID=2812955 RepID=UPI0025E6DEEC|nr:GNAT family N-acyltransferase [Natronospirillum sp.]MCH8551101.1 GNAT family N-acetyltransferase [Natronospirillum sp.]